MSWYSVVSAAELDSLTPRLAPDVLVRRYSQGVIAWAPSTTRPTALEGVDAVVLQILDGSATVAELVEDVHEVVGVPKAVARSQIRQSLEKFVVDGLLEGIQPAVVAPTKLDLFPAPPNP